MRVIPWKAEYDLLLGTAPDRVVAAGLGCPTTQVFMHRQELGVPPFRRHAPGSRHPGPVPRTWTAAEDALLGTMTDAEVAARIGVSHTAVHVRRRLLGVAPLRPQGFYPRGPSKWDTPEVRADLARLRDAQFARLHEVSRQYVSQLRFQFGVPTPPRPGVVGRPHGRSTILGPAPGGYAVRCQCGREYTVRNVNGRKLCGQCHAPRVDLAGQLIPGTRLTARTFLGNGRWVFDCTCGTTGFVARMSNVKRGLTKSCGCLKAEWAEYLRTRHGGWGEGEPPVWKSA